MRTTPIRMSHLALAQMVEMLELDGKWFLPECGRSAKNFLKDRGEWEKAGLAELNFDGELQLAPRMARLAYNMTHARRALLYEEGENKTLLLKGPVDVLALKYIPEEESWDLALRPFHETAKWLRELRAESSSGRLLTLEAGEGEPVCRALTDKDTGKEEENHAGSSDGNDPI